MAATLSDASPTAIQNPAYRPTGAFFRPFPSVPSHAPPAAVAEDLSLQLEQIMIAGIDHFVITVADLKATLHFYEMVLGLTPVRTRGRPASLHFGAQKINVHQTDRTFLPKAKRPTEGAADFCLIASRPLAEIKRRVEENGVAIELGPVERNGARGRMTSIYFRDPDGNLVEVSEYL